MTLSAIRWPLVLGAGVMSEVVVVIVLSLIILRYRLLIAPRKSKPLYTRHSMAPYALV
jgi:hypothetical protein